MDDEIRISVNIPLDSDGFLRRQCPTCEREFKWFAHDDGDPDAEQVTQYFCPRCGAPADPDDWATPTQVEYSIGAAGPELDRAVQDAIDDTFKGVKGMAFKPDPSFSLDIPTPEPLHEPNDMVIVEPPCHPNEPLKVPEDATRHIFCLICATPFTV
jgi:endogenous inhibitor of DNA gyrase (YacG/DUF329 family)